MANFLPAFEAMIKNEGGYKLHQVEGDRGGMTYAGIARKMHPRWSGWADIDMGRTPSAEAVSDFYRAHFWNPIDGDQLKSQRIAQTIFDFGVNTGTGVAVKLAQLIVGQTPDGVIGPLTLAALNGYDEDLFVVTYALAKVARYRDIVTRDRSQQKFFLGWINRALGGVV